MGSISRNWVKAKVMAFSSPWNIAWNDSGTGMPNHSSSIWCMAIYMTGIRNRIDPINRFFMAAISFFAKSEGLGSGAAAVFLFPPERVAPYPASMTAWMISWLDSVPSSYSTCILLVSKLTLAFFMPASLETAFSTRLEQAEQLIPVMAYFSCFISYHLLH